MACEPGENALDRPSELASQKPSELAHVVGAHARVVWVRDLGDGTDILSDGDQLALMGFDSEDGLGERAILGGPANYAKPLITPRGEQVVFTDQRAGTVSVVDWDGSGQTRLADGFGLATWLDPESGVEWVYVGSDEGSTRAPSYRQVHRYRLDRPEQHELVWDTKPVNNNSFQISADGRSAGGLFPWPRVGVADLESGEWRRVGRGCWTALGGDGSRSLLWYFDGSHRNLTMVDLDGDDKWQVNINNAPGIQGFEVYHPRWANHARFLTLTGPYTVGDEANKIRGGGGQVEIYVGRFSGDFRSVEAWARVTDNESADFYPDVWVDPDATVADSIAASGESASEASAGGPVVVEASVVASSRIPTPESILPYRQALLVNEYEIARLVSGSYSGERILVAHWVIRDGRVLNGAARDEGSLHRMTLEPYDQRLELEGERLILDGELGNLRLYYDTES